jgi:hypothetical protein
MSRVDPKQYVPPVGLCVGDTSVVHQADCESSSIGGIVTGQHISQDIVKLFVGVNPN